MRKGARRWLTLVCPLLLGMLFVSACDLDTAATSGVTVSDSAGVEVVSSDEPAWTAEDAWYLAEAPRLQLGTVEGEPEYEFDRIMGAVTLSDGRIAVADMGSSEVRLFDETGQHVMSVGGAGEGPGEFRQITNLYRLPEDLLAVEDRRSRWQFFGPDGTYREAVSTGEIRMQIDPVAFHENPPSTTRVVGWLEDGSFIGWESTQVTLSADRQFDASETVERTYARYGADGEVLGEMVRLPGTTFHPHPMNLVLAAVFGPTSYADVTEDHLILGESGSGDIFWYTLEGELERVARRTWPRRPVTDAMVDQYVEGSFPPLREDISRGRTFAEELPAFSDLMVDASGNVWVRQYEVSHGFTILQYRRTFEDPSRWVVFDPEGRWLGEVRMPGQFTALEIGDDYVLGMRRDEFDVEYVQQYDLVKP